MQKYQREFIEFALANNVLKFGEFKLKSGRISPYFINMGLLNSGTALAQLGRFYADAILAAKIDYDVLFGPAYKGIPLAASAVVALAEKYNIDKPFCFNRKEVKDHGEGGNIVGAPLRGRVLIIDDVITAGTAVNEAVKIIQANNAKLAGVIVAIDRQERGQTTLSAMQEIENNYQATVTSIVKFEHILEFLREQSAMQVELLRMYEYQQQYGILKTPSNV